MKGKQLAIVRDPGYGLRDAHRPILWFTTYLDESSAALQVFSQPRADEVITEFGVKDVSDLDGRACWVSAGGGMVEFLGAAQIPAR